MKLTKEDQALLRGISAQLAMLRILKAPPAEMLAALAAAFRMAAARLEERAGESDA
jgi:energy-coupling factor transporter transmembrane protein EcfT